MIFDKTTTAECVNVPPPPPPQPCLDSAYALAHTTCPSALIIKPSKVSLCKLEPIHFRVYDYQNGTETELTDGVIFVSAAPTVLAIGVNSGSGTALSAGNANVTATTTDGRRVSATATVAAQEDCCDAVKVATAIVIDNSLSSTLDFGGDYLTRLDFAKAAAKLYTNSVLAVNGIPKDSVEVWRLDIAAAGGGPSHDPVELASDIDSIPQGVEKTDLLPLFTTIGADLLKQPATRRVLFLLSDGEHTLNTNRQAILDAATAFRAAGGYVVVMGLRASGTKEGFDLLERIATPGFFINAVYAPLPDGVVTLPAFAQLNYLKSILCVGKCVPVGDYYVHEPSLAYSGYANWEIVRGLTNLLGPGLLDLLPGNGFYVEPVTPTTGGTTALIRTIDSFELKKDRMYKVQLAVAGNQRAPVAGQQLKVYVREDGIADGDPNLFQQIVAPDWNHVFQDYAFVFNAISDASVRLYIEQLYTGTPPKTGNLIDRVIFQESSTLTTLLDDNFDDENLVYVMPRCGPNAPLPAIDDPKAPTADVYFDSGELLGGGGGESLVPLMTSNTSPSGVVTDYAALDPSPALAYQAFDQNDTTRWDVLSELDSGLNFSDPPWIAYTFTTPQTVGSYSINVGPLAGIPGNAPANFQLQGSNNGVDWVTVDSRTGITGWVGAVKTFSCQNSGNYLGYRLLVTRAEDVTAAVGSNKHINIAELVLYSGGAGETYQYAVSYLTREGETAATRLAASGDNTTAGFTNTVIRVDMPVPTEFRVTRKRLWRSLGVDPGAYDSNATLYLLAELDKDQVTYLDSERQTAFAARYDDSIMAPASNTTAVGTGDLGSTSGYGYDCCQYDSLAPASLIPFMTSNTAPSGEVTSSLDDPIDFQAFDGNLAAAWNSVGLLNAQLKFVQPAWLAYTFSVAKVVGSYSILTAGILPEGSQAFGPGDFQLQGSNDGTTWTVLDTQTGQTNWENVESRTYVVAHPGAYRNYRLYVTKPDLPGDGAGANSNVNIFELKLFAGLLDNCETCNTLPPGAQEPDPSAQGDVENGDGPPLVFHSTKEVCVDCPTDSVAAVNLVPEMTSNVSPLGLATASSSDPGVVFDPLLPITFGFNHEPYQAFSLTLNKSYFWQTSNALPQWIGYKFAAVGSPVVPHPVPAYPSNPPREPLTRGPQVVNGYAITAGLGVFAPTDFKLQASNDGTTWTDLDARSKQAWTNYQRKNFSFSNEIAYFYYRLYILTSLGALSSPIKAQLGSLQLFGTATTGEKKCATAIGTGSSPSEADRDAIDKATALANAMLNDCVHVYSSGPIQVTLTCPLGSYGTPGVSDVFNETSLVGEQEAIDAATAKATAQAEERRVCNLSNNEQQITINDNTGGALQQASPYPTVKNVSGFLNGVSLVRVTIYGFVHPSPDDVRIVLRSPSGTLVELMRNCGSLGYGPTGAGINITFDDEAESFLPDESPLVAGTFKPSQFGFFMAFPLLGPPIAPATTYWTELINFGGENPNGPWSLWVVDDQSIFGGTIHHWDLTIICIATITGFTPTTGNVGNSVVITGTNFTGATAVLFNALSASYAVNSNTQITAIIPDGAATGPISVVALGGTVISTASFTVVPSIRVVSPTFGHVGNNTGIAGTNFASATAVLFNGTSASYTVVNNGQISVTVPVGATTGPISVVTPDGTLISPTDFTVLP